MIKNGSARFALLFLFVYLNKIRIKTIIKLIDLWKFTHMFKILICLKKLLLTNESNKKHKLKYNCASLDVSILTY